MDLFFKLVFVTDLFKIVSHTVVIVVFSALMDFMSTLVLVSSYLKIVLMLLKMEPALNVLMDTLLKTESVTGMIKIVLLITQQHSFAEHVSKDVT